MIKSVTLKKVMMVFVSMSIILAACATSKSNNSNQTNLNTNTGSSTGTTESASAAEKRGNISVSIYDRGNVKAEIGTIDNNLWTRWINENGPANVTFVPVPRWESKEKLNVMFAASNAPDIIFEYDTAYRGQLISQKQLLDVSDLIEEHSVEYKALMEQLPILRKVTTKSDGSIFEFARVNGPGLNHMFFIRQDWLDKLQLEVPTTTEELFQVAQAFVNNDPDGNNVKDTFGINVTHVGDYMMKQIFQDVEYKIENNTVVRAWDNKIARYNFVKQLYDNGLIDKDFLTDTSGEKAKQDFINGKLGIYGSNGAESLGAFRGLKENLPDAKVVAIKLPESEFGHFGPIVNNPVQSVAAINASSKDPVAAIKYIDFFTRVDTLMTLQFGHEGEHYTLGDNGVPQIINPDKQALEVNWTGDMRMMSSSVLIGDLAHIKHSLDLNNPVDAEYLEIYSVMEKIYLDPSTPMAELTHAEHMPVLPEDLQLIVTNTSEQMMSYYQQALIGGSKYSVEQAVQDARTYWEKAGGLTVDQWYVDWYAAEGQDAILTKDIYTLKIN